VTPKAASGKPDRETALRGIWLIPGGIIMDTPAETGHGKEAPERASFSLPFYLI
jgi:hypothetical protein